MQSTPANFTMEDAMMFAFLTDQIGLANAQIHVGICLKTTKLALVSVIYFCDSRGSDSIDVLRPI